jgi:hypothetical protein
MFLTSLEENCLFNNRAERRKPVSSLASPSLRAESFTKYRWGMNDH